MSIEFDVVSVDDFHKLNDLTQELFEKHNRSFRCLPPWVFVQVLRREQKVGSIIAPDTDQNKTIHEGIVLATWQPFTETRGKTTENGTTLYKTVERSSQFTPGDHICFAHWSGVPIYGFENRMYRVIPEFLARDSKEEGAGGDPRPLFKVEYDNADTKPREALKKIIEDTLDGGIHSDIELEQLLHKIESRFMIVDRDKNSITLSGR